MDKLDLTPRQQAAHKLGWKTYFRYARPILILLIITLGFAFFSRGTRFDISLWLPFSSWFVYIAVMVVAVITVVVAVNKATETVRRAGLLDEETQIVRRTATTFAGENLAFRMQTPSGVNSVSY